MNKPSSREVTPSRGAEASQRRAGQPIEVTWRVTRVLVLGPLEIFCQPGRIESKDASEAVEELPLDSINKFGPMARAALISLVLGLRHGRTPDQLQKAVDSLALQTHLGAVRRTGLVVELKAGIYRVKDLDRSSVDALQFEDLHTELERINAQPDEHSDALIIDKAEKALGLWRDDPVDAHPYFKDTDALRQLGTWLADIQGWYAEALVRRGEQADLHKAAELLRQIEARSPGHRVVHSVRGSLRNRSTDATSVASGITTSWLTRYRESLRNLADSLDLRGFGTEILSSSSLSEVYIPLYARPRSQEKPRPGERAEASRPLLETVVQTTRASVVVGESGSGKSTFLFHLCARYLGQEDKGLPLLLDLGALSEISEDRRDRHGRLSWQVLPAMLSSRLAELGIEVSVEELDALARTERVVWLADGLNEVQPQDLRLALIDAISLCAQRWGEARFVVTTTETALLSHGVPPGFQRVDVDELRGGDVKVLLERFSREYYSHLTEKERREKWEPLALEVRNSADLRDLAKSPLNLTAMALAYFGEDGRLPDSRADLLRGAVSWLVRKKAPVLRPYVRADQDLAAIFAELAFQMMAAEERPRSRVGKAWAAKKLKALDCFRGDIQEFLDAAVSAGGLFTPRGPGDLGLHDAFRNYLAATRIAAKTDDPESGWWSELAPRLDDPEWHSVVSLVPGALRLLGGSERVDLFLDRLGASCADEPLKTRAARVALGGAILRELSLSGYRMSEVPRWAEAVDSIGELFDDPGGVPLQVRYGAAVAYGIMGDDRLADWEVTWVTMPEGHFWMGAQHNAPQSTNYDPDAAAWESPVRRVDVPAFAIRQFPITVSEYRAFVEAGGYEETARQYWSPQGWAWRSRHQAEAPIEWVEQLSVPNAPVTGITWFECVAYCSWLTARDERGFVYRLPHEYEWEYAAKVGVDSSRFPWGDGMRADDDAEANWAGCFLRRKSPVGMFPKSTTDRGVADLFGNVEEFCMDVWPEELEAPSSAPPKARRSIPDKVAEVSVGEGSPPGTKRVVKGGSCIRFSRLCRPTYRSRTLQDRRYLTVGFRPVRVATNG